MNPSETIIVLEQSQGRKTQKLSSSLVARDVATMGSGTLLAAIFSTLQVFLIPRLISVEDYGYFRLFVLYASYAGFLHLGFADGALLRWVGKPLDEFRPEILPTIKFLICQQLVLLVPACAVVWFVLPSRLRFIGLAVLAFALIMNLATLLQYTFQGARLFKPVAIATAAPTGVFVAMVFLLHLRTAQSFRELIVLYTAGYAGMLAYLWARLRPARNASNYSPWSMGKAYIALGWPILLSNGGFVLVQSADRLVVSSTLRIYDFAQYSLAASTMFVPVMMIVAVFQVLFSHVAAIEQGGRAKVYAHTSKFLLLAWSLLLPYYFVLEMFIRQFLPKYVAALPVARIMLMGVIFLAGIQILHMSFSFLEGRQRQFLKLTIVAIGVSFSLDMVLARSTHSLVTVAIGQVGALAFWWMMNEWNLRKMSGQGWKNWLLILSVFAWSVASYSFAIWATPNIGLRILIYYAMAAGALLLVCFEELQLGWKLLVQAATMMPTQES
jgi:O-antigen/teichoic acid export membrane protein